jgi:membrane fusion protein (multidrug efflux system)
MRRLLLLAALMACACQQPSAAREQPAAPPRSGPSVEVVKVIQRRLSTVEYLPAELRPYLAVAIYPRVSGFVENIAVDRGSIVRRGQLLARLSAPELLYQRAEVERKLSADRATWQRLKQAAKTPGAVAPNEVEVAQDSLNADLERVRALRTLEGYLTITAPFDGIITERDAHPGALAAPPSSAAALPLLKLEQDSRLRLIVPVPEADAGAIGVGAAAVFTVSAWPGQSFSGTIARIAHSVDRRTRTMPVELDVDNRDGRLAPGMFAEVRWPVRREFPTLVVPESAVVETMEMTFVDAIRGGRVHRVAVKRGRTKAGLVEVYGALREGDLVAVRGSEELTEGTQVSAVTASSAANPIQ